MWSFSLSLSLFPRARALVRCAFVCVRCRFAAQKNKALHFLSGLVSTTSSTLVCVAWAEVLCFWPYFFFAAGFELFTAFCVQVVLLSGSRFPAFWVLFVVPQEGLRRKDYCCVCPWFSSPQLLWRFPSPRSFFFPLFCFRFSVVNFVSWVRMLLPLFLLRNRRIEAWLFCTRGLFFSFFLGCPIWVLGFSLFCLFCWIVSFGVAVFDFGRSVDYSLVVHGTSSGLSAFS